MDVWMDGQGSTAF